MAISNVVAVKYAAVNAALPSIAASAPQTWPASVTPVNEIQTVTVDATGGTFTATFGGATSAAIAFDALGETVEAALEALSSIGEGNISVTGAAGGPFVCTFIRDLGYQNVAIMTTDPASLTGGAGTAVPVETTPGTAGGATWTDVPGIDLEKGVKAAMGGAVRDIMGIGDARPRERHILHAALQNLVMSFYDTGEDDLAFMQPHFDLTAHVQTLRARGVEASYVALAIETDVGILEVMKVSPNIESEEMYINTDIVEPEIIFDTFDVIVGGVHFVAKRHFWGA